jgi:WD40 repeat protein
VIVLEGKKGDVTHLAFGPGGGLLAASGGGRGLEIWDLPSGNKWGRYAKGVHLRDGSPAFHPTRPLCYAPAYDGVVAIETDTKKARTLKPPIRPYFGESGWGLTPDGEALVGYFDTLNGIGLFRRKPDDTLKPAWSIKTERGTRASRDPMRPLAIRVSPDGEWFVCVEADRGRFGWDWRPVQVSVRSMKDGTILRNVPLPSGTHPWPAVAPAGRHFVTVCLGRFLLWKADDLSAKPAEVKNDNRRHFTGIAFHPSGRYLAATSNDATVKLYDTTTWKLAKTYTWDIGRMRSIAFSPDGTLAAAGSDSGKVVVWDVDL